MAHWTDQIYEDYKEFIPCQRAKNWAEDNASTIQVFWDTTTRGDWLIWLLMHLTEEDITERNLEYDECINKPEADKTQDDLDKLSELADILRTEFNPTL